MVQLANLVLFEGAMSPAGDINGDGTLNILDVVLLVNLILS